MNNDAVPRTAHLVISDLPPIVELRIVEDGRYGALLHRLVGRVAQDALDCEQARADAADPDKVQTAMQIMTRYAYMNAANGVNTPYPYQVELACLALDAGRLYDDLHPSTQKALHIAWRQAHEAFSSALRRAHALGVQARNSGDQPFATVHGQIIKGVALSWDDLTEHEQDALVIQWLRGKGEL